MQPICVFSYYYFLSHWIDLCDQVRVYNSLSFVADQGDFAGVTSVANELSRKQLNAVKLFVT
jgi:hypothetical protein